jgi:hypothetical protein
MSQEDNEENNVQIEEEIDNEIEASALQMEEDSEKLVAAALYTTNQTFSSRSGMQWRSQASVVTKRKACHIVYINPGLQNNAKID